MWHGSWRGWHMIIQSVEKYASWRKTLCLLIMMTYSEKSQVLHPQDWMPEHYTFSPSFTTELILSHPRKMLIPWKRNHSKSSRKNSSNKGLKSLVQPHKWSSWDVTEQRICLETIPPRLAGLLLPCQIPSITATLGQEGKIIWVYWQSAVVHRLEKIPQAAFRYLIILDCFLKLTYPSWFAYQLHHQILPINDSIYTNGTE